MERQTGPDPDEERCPNCRRATAFGDYCRRCLTQLNSDEAEEVEDEMEE